MVFDPEHTMENDKPNAMELGDNGNNLNNNKLNRGARFDDNRHLEGESGDDDDKESDLEKVKERNRDLKYIVGKMQNQLNNLTIEVQKLNEIIASQQKEKETLLELLQHKKSPKTSPKRKRAKVNSNRKTTQSESTTIEQKATNANNVNSNATALERDENMLPTSSNTVQIGVNNVKMSENTNKARSDTHELSEDDADDDKTSDDDTSSESDNESNKHKHTPEQKRTTPAENYSSNKHEREHKHTNKRSSKIPPVDIWTDNRGEAQTKIQNALPTNSCLFQRVNNSKFRVLPSDAQTRQKVIEIAKEMNYEYNTYTPNEEKMINVLIKGLDHIDEPKVIEEALATKGFTPHKIQKHITGYMRKNGMKSNLWLIVLQPNTDTAELFKIKSIESAIVKFEFLRKPTVIQCRRCQRFNHSASNCSLPYRCVKCTNVHEPGKCSSEAKGNKFKPKCVNCQGNHTANDAANCPEFKRVIELRTNKHKDKSKPNVPKPTNKKSSMRTSQSYAERVKMNQQQISENTRETKSIDQFVNSQNKMLSEFMATMKKMQQQFITSFNRTNG